MQPSILPVSTIIGKDAAPDAVGFAAGEAVLAAWSRLRKTRRHTSRDWLSPSTNA